MVDTNVSKSVTTFAGLTRDDWALIVQVVAALAAAVAAGFAWATARQVRNESHTASKLRHSEQLKTIHRLITQLVDVANRAPSETFVTQMRLRAEIGVTPVPLPKCLELADPAHGKTITLAELNALAPAAIAEVEAAQELVWGKDILGVLHGPKHKDEIKD